MRPHLIGITGPSCAGKGEVSAWLSAHLVCPILELDSYYMDQSHMTFEQRCQINYDTPGALDAELLFQQVRMLAEGEEIYKPIYAFELHTRATHTLHFQPARAIIVEGLFTLHWRELRDLFATKIFLDAPDDVCLRRRIERDTRERGRTEEEVRQRYASHVRPASVRYIRPTLRHADFVLDGTLPIEENGRKILAAIGPHL